MSKRVFINNLDTYVSQAIFSELRNDEPDEEGEKPEDANMIFGTYISKDSSIKPAGVTKMLKRSKPRLTMKYLAECDLIVYDLHSGNPNDVEMAIEALGKLNSEEITEEKVVILISSLLAWGETPRKLQEIREPGTESEIGEEKNGSDAENEEGEDNEDGKSENNESPRSAVEEPSVEKEVEEEKSQKSGGEGENEEGEGNEEQDDLKEASQVIEAPKPPKKKFIHNPFTEADYQTRQADKNYARIKEVEDLVLNFQKENIKTYVISAGVLYGKGEAIFNSHFRKAWLQDPSKLPVVGEGKNMVPTIHVTDLARMVKRVYESKPERRYIFGIDNTKKPTQKKLIQAISGGIGTGLIESVDIPVDFQAVHPNRTPLQLDLDWRKFMMLNIKVKPSSLFVPDTEGGEDGEEEEAEADEDAGDFSWHCKNGLAQNIQLVKEEFCKERGLKPFKIAITGKPCSGKSYFAQQLAEHFNVPHIHKEQVLEDIEKWNQEKEAEYYHKLDKKELEEQLAKDRSAKDAALKKKRDEDEEEVRKSQQELLKKRDGSDAESDDNISREAKSEKVEETAVASPRDSEKDGDEEDGEPKDPAQVKYEKLLALLEAENAESEEEFELLEIKAKIRQYKKENPKETKISSELMSEAFRWRLGLNDCQNRGYVLDGYPISYQTAKDVFVITPSAPEKKAKKLNEDDEEEEEEAEELDEEELAKALRPKFQKHIYPDSVIYLRGDCNYLRKKASELPKEDNVKWDKDNLERRLRKFNEDNDLGLFHLANNAEDLGHPKAAAPKYPMTRFFQENKTEVFEIDCDGNQFEMFEGMRVYIERNGRPYNYLSSVRHLNKKRETALQEEEEKMVEGGQLQSSLKSAENEQERKMLVALSEGRIETIKEHIDCLADCNKQHMRKFLMKCIIPVLTEGMIDVWRVKPTDPVDFLADYIWKKSNDQRIKKENKAVVKA